jgi:hypothetical protein
VQAEAIYCSRPSGVEPIMQTLTQMAQLYFHRIPRLLEVLGILGATVQLISSLGWREGSKGAPRGRAHLTQRPCGSLLAAAIFGAIGGGLVGTGLHVSEILRLKQGNLAQFAK